MGVNQKQCLIQEGLMQGIRQDCIHVVTCMVLEIDLTQEDKSCDAMANTEKLLAKSIHVSRVVSQKKTKVFIFSKMVKNPT